MKKGDYTSSLYQGGYSSLEPGYGNVFVGYRTSAGTLAGTTDPRMGNIMKEFSDKLAPGEKTIQLALIDPGIAEGAKSQMKEINRMSKLTGVGVAVHGPLVEASGLSKEGFSEANRKAVERQMFSVVESSHEASPAGNVPVTFHSSAMLPGPEIYKTKEGVVTEKLPVIDQESGQVHMVRREERYHPSMIDEETGKEIPLEKGKKYTAEEQVEILNNSQWNDSITKLIEPKERADRIIEETLPIMAQIPPGAEDKHLTSPQREVKSRYWNAMGELSNIKMHLDGLFDKAYKYSSEHDKDKLKEMAETFGKDLEESEGDVKKYSQAMHQLMKRLLTKVRPELHKAIPDFAFDKSATTFGNVAFDSYKKFGSRAPIISIENPPAAMGAAFVRGEDLKKLTESSREKFIERAVKEGMSKGEAKEQAEKLIGVSWDIGHINQLRKFGFKKEDIVKEAEEIAPYLKELHLSDNFGMENIEMPMGMGDVPFKEIMEKLGKKADDVKKVIEAGHWWQHFKTSPMAQSFEAMGSPIYAMKGAPYWNQSVGFQQGYFSGYGMMLPPVHYETFGSGFLQLPMELGGQRQSAQGGRMSGTPME